MMSGGYDAGNQQQGGYNQGGYQGQPQGYQGQPQGGYQPQPQGYNPGYQGNINNQPSYQPPVTNNNNVTPIIINSQSNNNVVVANDPFKFKTSSVLATCPSCRVSANTNVSTSLSISNLVCYICCDPLVWVLYQLIRGKDINCCDATHHCSGCGGFIANYQSC